ncbi:hypothetical protein F443_02988 [Phytophthora nicotianae P1569]|uniref:Uncharacterized protein n=1 Tax=Phytophthora nicotianae P1569 TaxID=1317065 RepID=V9FRN0_PHYNI|nr:hypothetical protein F443_02988 [Phytophthora nicotianae P1569]
MDGVYVLLKTSKNNELDRKLSLRAKEMTIHDIEAFHAILTSEHPEEELFRLPRGLVDEQDAILTPNAPIRWGSDDDNQSQLLTTSSSTPYVPTINDDGASEWVNMLLPGYGRCQVQRSDLTYTRHRSQRRANPIDSLEIEFDRINSGDTSGLPMLLESTGESVQVLTFNPTKVVADVNMILERYPNLQTLFLKKRDVTATFNFTEYQTVKATLPAIKFYSEDISALANELCDPDGTLTKCLQRLKIRHDRILSHNELLQSYLMELFSMLETNQHLEYLRVLMYLCFGEHIDAFRKYHHQPISRSVKLPTVRKLCF